MNSKFTEKAQNALNFALIEARRLGHTYVGSEHLLLGIAAERDCAAARILSSRGASFEKLSDSVSVVSGCGGESKISAADMTPCAKKIIENSFSVSSRLGQNYIGTEHILIALLEEEGSVGIRVLERANVSPSDLKADLTSFLSGTAEKKKPVQKKDISDSVLLGYGRDLTRLAENGRLDPVIGRTSETERMIRILSRRMKNNPCLIGEPGVGKTAVVEGLAQKIADGDVPETLRGKKIITLDIPSMIAGAKYRGEFEDRMKNVMKELAKDRDLIVFIDEIHTIVGAGAAEGAVDAANIIKPALARGDIRLIGATTISEYHKHIEKDAALERRFQPILVEEPSQTEAIEIITGLKDSFEAHHRLKIDGKAIEAAVRLSARYLPDRFLPDKAIDLIDETAARLRVRSRTAPIELRELEGRLKRINTSKEEAIVAQDFELAATLRDEEKRISEEYEKSKTSWGNDQDGDSICVTAVDIARTLSDQTGIPIGLGEGLESDSLLRLEEKLKERVIGQDAAIDNISRAVRRGRAGISDPKKPTGSFIFLGPTGVGKTELAKALAAAVYGSENALIRLDMSEFMEKHSVSKLIGSPPGYVGYDEGGLLTERVRRHPYSLVLFDEIEKAHPDIFNILLQILDDGMLTDSTGRTVNFKNTIIIMTSNLGSGEKRRGTLGFFENPSENEARADSALRAAFRPEFLNRVDDIIVFKKLTDADLSRIAEIQLSKLRTRCEALGIGLSFAHEAVRLLADAGKDEAYGARPIRRALTRLFEDPLASYILNREFVGGDTVMITAENGKVKFEKQ